MSLTGSTGRIFCLLLIVVAIAPLVTIPSAAAASGDPAAGSNANCVCGPKQVAVLLFDFVDVKHTQSPEYFSGIVKDMNASLYRQSYRQLWIVGGEVYGWYDSKLALQGLRVRTWNVDWGDAEKLETVAQIKAGQLGVGGKYILAVFAGDVWAWATKITSKLSVIGEERWGFSGFMHEFGHNLGLPDLYNYANLKAEPVGEWDVMDQGDEEFSAYSRWKLGWLPQESVVNTYSGRDLTVFVNSLDSANGTRALKIQLYSSSRWLLGETRRKLGSLYFVLYRIEGGIESGKGSIVLEVVLVGDKLVFFDKSVNAAFIILDGEPDALKVRIAREAEGNKAQQSFDALESASESLASAWRSDRVQGFNEAKQELDSAWQSFHSGDFDAAGTLAMKAAELAETARTPESYLQFEGVRATIGARLENASAYNSDQAVHYVELAKSLLQNADGNFTEKNFDTALSNLLGANQTLTEADEAERAFVESQQVTGTETHTTPVLAIVMVSAVTILVIVGLWRMTRRKTHAR